MADSRTILTLDAGGTTFSFHAIRNQQEASAPLVLPSHADDLGACLSTLVDGFNRQKQIVGGPIAAISFAFPGPADYARGIIGDLQNLPAFRGGVAVGPFLEDAFGVPVYINNDGDLFTYGEALFGILPKINELLASSGSPKCFRNLLGLTLGTGFGAGVVTEGHLLRGDNSAAAEIWCLRNKLDRNSYAEEGVSIRAIRQAYAVASGMNYEQAPDPREIAEIAAGTRPGNVGAAKDAYTRMGEVAGDAAANAVTMVDGIVVIGGGLAGASEFFLQSMVEEMNRDLASVTGRGNVPRMELKVFNLEEPTQLQTFLKGQVTTILVPGAHRRHIAYDPMKRIGVAVTRLGTARAVALGAYAYAIAELDRQNVCPAQIIS
ncbi:ROK family protein [Geothrix sp. PMB-07]|uniref:ROK family protein n=1 Tax=Geothrix sp. PMB-07 TaxID=3068640 RepID=UPI0027429A7D|nr:ROK family protein [Geothrix sp. PMB-07]WLT30910.1 ROK family protein [Geothrix sp. PMB-07]